LKQYKEVKAKEKEAESKNPFEEEVDDPNNPFFEQKEEKKEVEQVANETSPFAGLISSCFEPYLNIYIESQDRNLADLVERAAIEQRERGHAGEA